MFKILSLTLVLSTIGAIASEMYIPSMPFITAWFHVDNKYIQYSLTAYLFGSLIPALFFGALADVYGRKKIILSALLLGLVGTLGCLFAPNIYIFIFCRFIQGFGFSSTNGIGRALLRDYYEGAEFAKYSSYLSMGFALSVDITPFIGGVLQRLFNWHMVFAFLALFNLAALYVAVHFPFKKISHAKEFNLRVMLRNYLSLTKNPQFIRGSLIGALVYSVFVCYLSTAAFFWEKKLKLSSDGFGLITLLLSASYILGCFLNSRIVRFGLQKVLRYGLLLIFSAGFLLFCFALNNTLTVWQLFLVISMIFAGSGLVFANASSLAMSSIEVNFSSASALFSFNSTMAAVIFSGIINLFDATQIMPLAIMIMFLTGCAILIQRSYKRC